MVETAVTDIVRGTVTTDDPLRTLYEVVIQGLEFLANGAALGSALGDASTQLRSNLLRLVGILAVVNPLLSESLVLVAGIAVDHLLEQLSHALLHLLVTKGHTETELAEVLEQRAVCFRADISEVLLWEFMYKLYNKMEKNTDYSIISQNIATFVPDFS